MCWVPKKTPQPTPGHICDYSQVADEELVILTNDSTNTESEKTAEKACQQEENEQRERECKVEHKAKCKEAKRQKVEEERLEAEQRKRAEEEEEAQRRKVAEEEAERQRQRAQAWQEEAAQSGTQKDEEEPATPHKGPSVAWVHMWWVEWEWEWQLQAAECHAEAYKRAVLAFKRMAEAAEWTADEWGTCHAWVEWAEMRRRQDTCKARMAELEHVGGGWKRPESEVAEDKNEEPDEGVEGDNKEEEEVRGGQGGGEGQEGGGEHVMEE
ncbi:hypothetical protein M404DRAFT_19948 [Pisolithus tinctorius Marx 270]|uniref:Uncharacterized protein n=1 Tax=Pisolithus tinctorius Marx 270 TaxID=870435 RepID=A0A0C3PSH7_PISTI|nr:hypothetical protein M404DRAFT_19948 [Pisolithus tinctorius Marx 270]